VSCCKFYTIDEPISMNEVTGLKMFVHMKLIKLKKEQLEIATENAEQAKIAIQEAHKSNQKPLQQRSIADLSWTQRYWLKEKYDIKKEIEVLKNKRLDSIIMISISLISAIVGIITII